MTTDANAPRVALLIIGDELLDGRIADANGPYFARRLREHGVPLTRVLIAGDAMSDLVSALEHLSSVADFVLCAGGLGPTEDDRTRFAIAKVLGVELVEHEASWDVIVERFARSGRTPSPSNRVQILHPAGSRILPNPVGTAPGFVSLSEAVPGQAPAGHCRFAAIPGVPIEARRVFEDEVLPLLATSREIHQDSLLFAGVPESTMGARLEEVMREDTPCRVGITASWGLLKVTVRAPNAPELEATLSAVRALGEEWFAGRGSGELEDLLVRELAARGELVAVAESCTGGRVASRITAVPGASAVLEESFVTYSNDAKSRLLAVPEAVFLAHGAVSEPCVDAMVRGLAERSGAALCAAVSGIAGPSGGSAEKPVGLVHFAVSYRGQVTTSSREYGAPGREVVQGRAAADLLLRMLRALDGRAGPESRR